MADTSYSSDTQFAGLVEAATAAADQEIQWSNNVGSVASDGQQHYDQYGGTVPPEGAYTSIHIGEYDNSSLNPRGAVYPSDASRPSTRKRKRVAESDSPSQGQLNDSNLPTLPHASPSRTSVSAPSAAALFRQPSASSKKYTRPPMSKLYSSLELSPESFLHLQAAAKGYMLDEHHPERRDCVGQRGRGDTDLVKLKLWNCVKDFLDDLGNGEKYFGDHVNSTDGHRPRTMFWPKDAQQIIKLCVPLLRRMVTNERQRQYAVETRKGGDDTKDSTAEERGPNGGSSALKSREKPRLSRTEALQLQIPDLFDEYCTPGSFEAAEWYDLHMRSDGLVRGLSSLDLTERDSRILIANIDGHYRLFHEKEISGCDDVCEAKVVERILAWEPFYDHQITSDSHDKKIYIGSVLRRLLEVVKADLLNSSQRAGVARSRSIRQTTNRQARSHSMDPAEEETKAEKAIAQVASSALSKPPSEAVAGLLILHINVVATSTASDSQPSPHPSRRVMPPFSIPAASAPDLTVLRSKIEEHYGERLPAVLGSSGRGQNHQRSDAGMDFMVKVWLPDGLVRVVDDGQWMVALLSAEMVEWMDKEVKVLVEVSDDT